MALPATARDYLTEELARQLRGLYRHALQTRASGEIIEFIIAAHLTNLANIYHHAKGLPSVRKVRAVAGVIPPHERITFGEKSSCGSGAFNYFGLQILILFEEGITNPTRLSDYPES